ncbi:MAG: prephenate dehydrogenase [Flavobacteriales bacterium]|nr:prephenate dehydrogenase [Flavobacteriales bacterium]
MKSYEISVIGLGLIGCSIVAGLKKNGFAHKVLGMDIDHEHEQQALKCGLIDEIVNIEQASKADIVIVATPVNVSARIVKTVLDISGGYTTVMDVGSTKKNIVESVEQHPAYRRFVPTHPMAGTEYSGPLAAKDDLFQGHTVIMLPYSDGDKDKEALVEQMYRTLGAEIVKMTPEKHDVSVAYVSHISHISSYALALTVLNKERSEENITNLAAGGFASTARLAKSSADMWVPIFTENKDAVVDVLDEYIENLILFKHAIKSSNADVVRTLITQANKVREVLDRNKK